MRSPALDGPRLPEAGARIWGWYQDLDAQRQYGAGFGVSFPQPIGWQAIDAYFRRAVSRAPAPWQVKLVADLDVLYRATVMAGPEEGQAASAAELRRSLLEGV